MPHDITDNRSQELVPEINNFLADSIHAHFADCARVLREAGVDCVEALVLARPRRKKS